MTVRTGSGVEPARFVVEGMHKDGADTDLFGDSHAAGNGVAEQILSQPAGLVLRLAA